MGVRRDGKANFRGENSVYVLIYGVKLLTERDNWHSTRTYNCRRNRELGKWAEPVGSIGGDVLRSVI